MIVQNIEESIVIIDDKKIELVNKQFLNLFKNIMIEFHNDI